MSETADYDPGGWKGYDFTKAKKTYDTHVGRSYTDAVSKGTASADLVPKSITTDSPAPVVIAVDVTGSMGDWPATIFSKLPYLDLEGAEYLGKGLEFSFCANGDVGSDKYPLQVQQFGKGQKLTEHLKKLVIERGGGSNNVESYETTALYLARNVTMPKAVRNPICIFIGDEGAYEYVSKAQAQTNAHVRIQEAQISTRDIFEELKKKFSVYIIRKEYSADYESTIQKQWVTLLGADHVCMLPSAERVVDVIFGIFAKETDRVDYFHEEIEGRQDPDQVKTVYKSLKTIHKIDASAKPAPPPDDSSGKSVMFLPKGPKTKGLLPGSKKL